MPVEPHTLFSIRFAGDAGSHLSIAAMPIRAGGKRSIPSLRRTLSASRWVSPEKLAVKPDLLATSWP